jgi:hypothetical protein
VSAGRSRPRASLSRAKVARPSVLLVEVRGLILEARQQTARMVNAGLTLLYWHVGDRVRREVLQEKRAEYGSEIVQTLATKLVEEFGRGFGEKSLRHMIRFTEAFPDERIVSALLRHLSWSHFLAILYLKDPLQRDFYAEMCRVERWSTRTLQARIQSMLFEHGCVEEAEKAHQARARCPPRNGSMEPRSRLPRSLCARLPRPPRHLQREGPGERAPP